MEFLFVNLITSLYYNHESEGIKFMEASFNWVFDNYDLSILYHVGKANLVLGSFSKKTVSMSCLTFLSKMSMVERHLALDIQSLTNLCYNWMFQILGVS